MDANHSWKNRPKSVREVIDRSKILPVCGEKNILITSALPYVNNIPHLGNIIGCVLSADVFARYCRQKNYNCLFICGTDEYGTATETKALQENLTPSEICDKYFKVHKAVYDWFNIDFDNFGRTTTQFQTEISQYIFTRIYENGYCIEDTMDQLFCAKCERFLADRFIIGECPFCHYDDARGDQCDSCGKLINAIELINPHCQICKLTPIVKPSNHIFLCLDKLTEVISKYLNETINDSSSKWSANAVAIARSWLKAGLEKRCITRDLKWGVKVPLANFSDKVFYVWFDAPIGYLSITRELLGDNWTEWWKNPSEVELYNFVGKDNVAFHSIMFPACLLAANDNFTLVKHLCATEYLNYENMKFSKSRGTGIFGDMVEETGVEADIWRFYLLYMRPETQDTSFAWNDFALKVNSELLNNLGNFINRALSFVASGFGGIIPNIDLTNEDNTFLNKIQHDLSEYDSLLHSVKLRDGIIKVLSISRLGNLYMQSMKPWILLRGDEGKRLRAGTIIGVAANIVYLLAVILHPYMPETSRKIRSQCDLLDLPMLPETPIEFLRPGHRIGQPKPLFVKLDDSTIEKFRKKFGVQDGQGPMRQSGYNVKTSIPPTTDDGQEIKTACKPTIMCSGGAIYNGKLTSLYANKRMIEMLRKELSSKLGEKMELFSKTKRVELETRKKNLQKKVENLKAKLTRVETTVDEKEDDVHIGRLDLRVGRILKAEKHPNADALYVEQIDLGEDRPRTVISGLVRFVPIEQMENRLVVCLCNLKPVKMRGIESQAMVMCASTPEKVEILEVDPSSAPGSFVSCLNVPRQPDAVMNVKKVWEKVAADLFVDDKGFATYKGCSILVKSKTKVIAPTLRNVPIK